MPYEPTNWKSGDVVTSAKLNKIEGGIASGGVLVVTETDGTLDKTWQEIHDAVFAVVKSEYPDFTVYSCITHIGSSGDDYYYIKAMNNDQYATTSANGYPVIEE